MSRRWAADASPIILLANVDRVDLLSNLSDELVIPRAVANEIHAGPDDDAARQWMREVGDAFVQGAPSVVPEVAAWDLGRGESAVLSWAHEGKGWTALLDDGAARQAARALDVPVTGTLGIVLAAKEEGEIAEVRPLVEALIQAGLRIDGSVLEEVLRLAGEA